MMICIFYKKAAEPKSGATTEYSLIHESIGIEINLCCIILLVAARRVTFVGQVFRVI